MACGLAKVAIIWVQSAWACQVVRAWVHSSPMPFTKSLELALAGTETPYHSVNASCWDPWVVGAVAVSDAHSPFLPPLAVGTDTQMQQ